MVGHCTSKGIYSEWRKVVHDIEDITKLHVERLDNSYLLYTESTSLVEKYYSVVTNGCSSLPKIVTHQVCMI